MTDHIGLPVAGYRAQSDAKVDLVNGNKRLEERCLQALDRLADLPDTDKRYLAIGRTHLETAWMWVNRSVFKPDRVSLD
jgi:hypothetical protein